MAGTLFGLGLSQQHDIDGRPMSGCLLYIYLANSTTPAIAYRSPALAAGSELSWPMVADSMGRLPAFWLADGAYRARLTDSAGIVQFDEGSILAVGSGSGDVFVSSTPTEAIFTTGSVTWMPAQATRAGWVRLNGKTIGNAASGAGERSNADCQALFEYLWATFADVVCPVLTGRGASAASDWAAAKQLTLFDMRGKAAHGLDDMGNVAAGVLAGVAFDAGDATTGGAKGGDARVPLVTANLPPYTPAGGVAAPTITTKMRYRNDTLGAGAVPFATTAPSSTGADVTNSSTADAPAFTGTAQGGTSTPVQTISPFLLGTWLMKL